MKMLTKIAMIAGGVMLLLPGAAWCQASCSTPPCGMSTTMQHGSSQTTDPTAPIPPPDSPLSGQMEHDQAKMRAMDRQKQIVSDTDKLLALAIELKADVDKSNKDTLSLAVLKKADEIEKLAHSVKEKTKGN